MGVLITCQKCRALLEPGTRECPYCNTDTRHLAAPRESEDAERTTRFGLWILGLNIGIYFLMVALDPARDDPGTGSFRPSGVALEMFGAADPALVRGCGQWWRLLASVFLHVDLLHLTFNCIALLILIPIAANAFGVHRTACLYLVSGLGGSVLSQWVMIGGVGASGALCGLIGACAVYGYRRGGSFGRALTRQMMGWAGFIAILGLAMQDSIDNAGHLGGFLCGAALGWLASGVRARGGAGDRAWTFFARTSIVGALFVAGVFWAPFVLRIFERREVELFAEQAYRTLRAITASLGDGATVELPATFPDGPGGTEAVRDAVREALSRARDRAPDAAEALARARQTLASWSHSLFCSHVCHVRPSAFVSDWERRGCGGEVRSPAPQLRPFRRAPQVAG